MKPCMSPIQPKFNWLKVYNIIVCITTLLPEIFQCHMYFIIFSPWSRFHFNNVFFSVYKKICIPGIWPENSGNWLNPHFRFDEYLWTGYRIYPQPSRGRPGRAITHYKYKMRCRQCYVVDLRRTAWRKRLFLPSIIEIIKKIIFDFIPRDKMYSQL